MISRCMVRNGPRFRHAAMVGLVVSLLCCGVPAGRAGGNPIVGKWRYQDPQQEIVADFKADGTFDQVTKTTVGTEQFRGRYNLSGQTLMLQPDGYPAEQINCRFEDPDTMALTYQNGMTLVARRVRTGVSGSASATLPSSTPGRGAPQNPAPPPISPSGRKPAMMHFQRVWEPNERAFTVLVPEGWQTAGGIFNVNPLQMNGSGNTIAPKTDFAVKSDERGRVMIHWIPIWNYADLTYSPTGFSFFKPGQYYQGMPVRVMISPKQFLTELIQKERPQAREIRVVAEDPMQELTAAFMHQTEQVNRNLQQMGLFPIGFSSMGMVFEYEEGGERYRESAQTTIADNRRGGFLWSNENTIMFRAPVSEFETWKPILDTIQTSVEPNPQWLAAVTKAMGERASNALETQRYLNRVANEIVENRRKTNAEIRHEQWLLISGQEEYKNPFNGQVERGTSAYAYRWESNQGDIIYTDENSYDPNRHEKYGSREWRRSVVWDRQR